MGAQDFEGVEVKEEQIKGEWERDRGIWVGGKVRGKHQN